MSEKQLTGKEYADQLNQVLRSQKDENLLAVNPEMYGKQFQVTLDRIRKSREATPSAAVISTTCLRIMSEIRNYERNSAERIQSSLMIEHLNEINQYLLTNSQVLEEINGIKI